MTIDWKAIATGLDHVLKAVEAVAPEAAIAGPQAAAIGAFVGGAASFADSLLGLAQQAGVVLTSNDLATIQAATAKLRLANNAVAAQIAANP